MNRRALLLVISEVDAGNAENANRILDALEAAGALRTPGTTERCAACGDAGADGIYTLAARDRGARPCPAMRCPVRLGRQPPGSEPPPACHPSWKPAPSPLDAENIARGSVSHAGALVPPGAAAACSLNSAAADAKETP